MQITQTLDRVEISFPFALKDAFKEAFRGYYKWDNVKRTWSVPLSEGARLRQWASEADTATQEVIDHSANLLTTYELDRVREEIKVVRAETAVAVAATTSASKALEMIQAAKAELAATKAAHASAQAALAAERALVEKSLSEVIDFNTTRLAGQTVQNSVSRTVMRQRAMDFLEHSQGLLRAAGLVCVAIKKIVSGNSAEAGDWYEVERT